MVEKPRETLDSSAKADQRDAVFNVLSDSRRRFSLQHLRGADTPIKVGELTRELASWEARRSVAGGSGGDTDAIEATLVHNHLPRMAEAGIVEYDANRRTVALTDNTTEIQTHLEITGSD